MSYLTLTADDHGLIDFGCNSYGGLAIRDTHPAYRLHDASEGEDTDDENANPSFGTSFARADEEDAEFSCFSVSAHPPNLSRKSRTESLKSDNTTRFLSEHNLALFWKRPSLYPHTVGFPVPLLQSSTFYDVGVRKRPPGNLRVDTARLRRLHRNLLAGEWIEGTNDRMQLWAVNDLSDRQALLTFPVHVHQPSSNARLTRAVSRDVGSRLDLPKEALQLRAFCAPNFANKVFVRTPRSLLLANTAEREISTVFNSSVRSFAQIPYMDDEFVVADGAGFVFWGAFGSAMSRQKNDLDIQQVVPTDCPRLLLMMDEKQLVQTDLRIHNDASTIFSLEQAVRMSKTAILPGSSYEYSRSREKLCHANAVEVQAETFLLTTTRRHFLIDRRMPNRELLSMAHSEINGGDLVQVTTPFRDPMSNGFVYSVYSLTQATRPAMSHWAVMYHSSERMWSSMGAKYELQKPGDFFRFSDYHCGIRQVMSDPTKLPKYTRAFHYQQLPQRGTSDRQLAFMFRQMEGGEIWYENVVFNCSAADTNGAKHVAATGEISSKSVAEDDFMQLEHSGSDDSSVQTYSCEYRLKLDSLKLIRKYFTEQNGESSESSYIRGVDETYLRPSSSLVKRVDFHKIVAVSNEEHESSRSGVNLDPFATVGVVFPVAEEETRNVQVLEKIDDDKRLLSGIIVSMQNKTAMHMKERIGEVTVVVPQPDE